MHRKDGKRTFQLHRKIAVGYAVKAVERDRVKAELRRRHFAVDGIGRPRQRAAAEGGHIHTANGIRNAPRVADEHHGIR